MIKFIAEESFWNLFPNSKLGLIVVENMNNDGESNEEIKKLLLDSNEEAKKYILEGKFSESPVISIWRKAYQQFKTKKGARCSIEALLKRVEKNNYVSSINSLVDIYNSASLKYGMPCGAEDIDKFEGNLRLTITEGGDEFYLIGDENNNPTLEGELCYKDDKGAVCRCFNWRDGERTMITEKTRNAFIIIELLDPNREDDLNQALDFLKENIEKYLSGKARKHILDKNSTEIELI